MFRHSLSLFILGILTSSALAQLPQNPPGRAYKVAFWYDSDQPVSTLNYQVYDVAKGEYDEKALDRWFRAILDHDPKHGAYIRDLSTEGQPGDTEADRLKSAIEAEKKRWAELHRQPSKPIPNVVGRSTVRYRSIGSAISRESRTAFDRPAPGSPGVIANSPTSPFPYPYRSGPR
jgi:hypothetical protein